MHQHFTVSLIRKTPFLLVATLLAGMVLSAIPYLMARAAVIEVGCDVTGLISAINTANGNGEADTINLEADCTYTLTTTNNTADGPNGLPVITSEIVINGNGATIERSSAGGTPEFRIFHVASNGNLTLNDLTLANGDASDNRGGGIYSVGTVDISRSALISGTASFGGGIYNEGTATINNTTLSANQATLHGGGIFHKGASDISINNSTLSGNTASFGGGIYSEGEMDVSNSTLSGNTANENGGGAYSEGTMHISNSTFSGNTAEYGGGILNNGTLSTGSSTVASNTANVDGGGGGIHNNTGTTGIANTIVAGNTGGDCAGTITSGGYNMDSDGFCVTDGVNNDSTNATPGLGPLQDNDGPTWTHALLDGSPAIEQIDIGTNGCGTTYTTDQRRYDRASGVGHGGEKCEIGAFEYDSTPANTPTPTETPTDTPTPTPTSTPFVVPCDVTGLINDINAANDSVGADIIDLEAGCTYALTTTNNTTDGPNGLPSITSQITIKGNGATIDRDSGDAFRILHVGSGGDLTLTDITIANGDAGSYFGGGIYSKGVLHISSSTLSGNAGDCGGGICNGGTLNVDNSTLSGNMANYGGGICGGGALSISNSTLSANTATAVDGGGGIYSGGTGNVKNTIIAGNTPNDCDVKMTSQGYNMDSDGLCVTDGINNDITTGAPGLGPLQDNGGPTWTHALLPGSLAIGHIPYDTNGCGTTYTTDQRGADRPCPTAGTCDVGAYEGEALFGDVDCDCDVDIGDIMLVASRWRCQRGDACYDAHYDLNGDGDIDIVDIMLVAAHWEDVCP